MRSCSLLVLMLLTAPPALADEPVLSPDRPGLGESQGTPGVGFFNLEGGVTIAISEGEVVPGIGGITLRYGVEKGVEVRASLPDLVLVDGELEFGPAGVGVKLAGHQGERFSVSAVPTFLVGLDGMAGYQVSVNGGMAIGDLGLWLNATSRVLDGVSVLGGGGATYSFDVGGVYMNAGHEAASRTSFVGGGGWWTINSKAQLDVGLDVYSPDNRPVFVIIVGTSHAF